MGWGWLGKLGKIAAGIAAPFTGGASLLAIPAIGAAEGAANGGGWTGALGGALGGAGSALTGGGGGGFDIGGGSTMGADPSWLMGDQGGGGQSIWQRIGGILTGKGTGGQIAGTAGDIATGIEKGRSEDRNSENQFNLAQDQTRLRANEGYENALENRAGIEMKQKGFQQDYENNAYRNAIMGALGKNLQDVTVGGVGKNIPVVSFGGGLRPSAIGEEGRAAAALLNTKAMKQLQDGTAFTALPDIERFTPSDRKKGNWIDTVLGGVGIAGKAGDIWNERGNAGKDRDWIEKIRKELEDQQKPKAQVQPPFLPGTEMTDQNGNPVVPDVPPTPPTPAAADPLSWLRNMPLGR